MQATSSDIVKHFPFPSFREGQQEAIEAILGAFAAGKKYAILDAPTGSGKSPIGVTVSRFFEKSFYITGSKMLQDQLLRDFGADPEIEDLKGRNAYTCIYWDECPDAGSKPAAHVPCSEGFCKVKGKASCQFCLPQGLPPLCPYFHQAGLAARASLAVMNFSSFLYQINFAKRFTERNLLIIDEAHNTESQLLDFVSLTLSDISIDIPLPELKSAKEYQAYFKEKDLPGIIRLKILEATQEEKVKDIDRWSNLKSKLDAFMQADPAGWVCQWKVSSRGRIRTVELKPIFVNEFARKHMFRIADHVLLMSATIISPKIMCDSLGIRMDDVYVHAMPNLFPPEHRPIFFDSSVGAMSYRNRQATLPKMIKKITEICRNHDGLRGIIHTHNFWLSEQIVEGVPPDVRKRLLYQKEFFSKQELLKRHEQEEGSIIIGPAWHEGLDLKDDLGRFAIICKVPFPSAKDNPQLKARMDLSQDYYNYVTALKLVQSYGRTVRSLEDWAITYILDGDFGWFRYRASDMMPAWFEEVVEGR